MTNIPNYWGFVPERRFFVIARLAIRMRRYFVYCGKPKQSEMLNRITERTRVRPFDKLPDKIGTKLLLKEEQNDEWSVATKA